MSFKLRKNILEYKNFDDIYSAIQEHIPANGTGLDALLDFVEQDILPFSTNYSSPLAMAFPDCGNSVAGITASILSNFINQNLINWTPCSPVGTIIEMVVINWLRELVGYQVDHNPKTPQDVGGFITSGGVASNTIAMLLARENRFPGCLKNGVQNITQKFVCIVPEGIDHYSSRLSIGWLGLGSENVVKAKTKDYKYDLPALESLLSKLVSEGTLVLSLTAYAGDSRSMTCDNFRELRKMCNKFQIWFHVDGCHGTQLLFSKRHRETVSSIELADSITFDPHKVLTLPYAISAVLVKDPSTLASIRQPEDIIIGEKHSFGQITPFYGSRPFNSLKLYMIIRHLGCAGIGSMVENRCALARKLADMVSADKNLKLLNPMVNINSVMFMYIPTNFFLTREKTEFLNLLNTNIQKTLFEQGAVWLHNFEVPDSANVFGLGTDIRLRPLRYMSGNPNTTENDLIEMLELVKLQGQKIFKADVSSETVSDQTFQKALDQASEHTKTCQDKNSEININEDTGHDIMLSFVMQPPVSKHICSSNGSTTLKRLSDAILTETDKVVVRYLSLQVLTFITSCHSIKTTKFGRMLCPGVGSEHNWSKVFFTSLEKLKAKMAGLVHFQKPIILDYIDFLAQVLSRSECVNVLNGKESVLVPMLSDLSKVVILENKTVKFLKSITFVSGDLLLAYGQFLSNTFGTPVGDSFLHQLDHMDETDMYLINAYSMMETIKNIISLISEKSNFNITKTGSVGISTTFVELLELNKQFLASKEIACQHISTRSSIATTTNKFLGPVKSSKRVAQITKMIRRFCSKEFSAKHDIYYVIIYGSYAYGMAQPTSDLDVLFVAENVDDQRTKRLVDFVVSLHDMFGMRKDNEIPYEKKVLFSTKFVKTAVEGGGTFMNGKWQFPMVSKDKAYLMSEPLLLRFVQGMMVNPHVFVSGNFNVYTTHRKCATINTIKAVMFTHNLQCADTVSLAKYFCIGSKGQTGDFYIGFTYKQPFISYLYSHLEASLSSSGANILSGKCGTEYSFSDEELLKVALEQDIH